MELLIIDNLTYGKDIIIIAVRLTIFNVFI